METPNYELMTNDELKEYCNKLSLAFESSRQQMMEIHNIMVELSNEFNKIKDIIGKRGGKI